LLAVLGQPCWQFALCATADSAHLLRLRSLTMYISCSHDRLRVVVQIAADALTYNGMPDGWSGVTGETANNASCGVPVR
jgi:hypothetical protein